MVRASVGLDVAGDREDVDLQARRRLLETPWPTSTRSGPARDACAVNGDLRAYTVGDWLMILLRIWSAAALSALMVGGLAAVLGAPVWLVFLSS